jgi:hypothetical protein
MTERIVAKSTRAVPSLKRLSLLTMVASRRGAPTSPKTASTATGSVAETIAPKRSALPQDSPCAGYFAHPCNEIGVAIRMREVASTGS